MKTTIAISRESRKVLQKIKIDLEYERKHFIDMDECMQTVLEVYKEHKTFPA